MPRGSRRITSDGLRQTTLLDLPPTHRLTPGRQRGSTGPKTMSSPPSKDSEESSSDNLAAISFAPETNKATPISISSDDGNSSSKPKAPLKRKSKRIISASPSEPEAGPSSQILALQGSDSEESGPLRKRRRLRQRKPVDELSSSEDNLVDLADEVEEDRILHTRMRKREKTAFQKNLEKLKRRKMKLKDDEGSSDQNEKESESDNRSRRLFRGSKPSGDVKSDDSDDSSSRHSSDFIVDDDTAVELPPEFSMETHEDLSHQFKKIFQFFVHVAVQSASKRAAYVQKQMRDEQYFSVPLQIVRRNLSGLRDSLVSSSVWRPGFKNSLQKYPNFELTQLDFAVPSCDACHLGGRLSTLLGRLSGSFYNPCGFEPIPNKNTDEATGEEFHLGRFCAKRTRVFHEFSHWEYNLFQSILREISELRSGLSSTGFLRVAYAGGREPPEDLEDADGLCDWLDRRKIIDTEWQTMKLMMESARHLELEKRHVDD
ncbi:hypothetical protein HYPSUDRAFT_63453 [Hypholoma sublateritium FD-334 SS-4]|uniref:DUF4211 domain-containing protein n=1 Tax=Hypholoma sublateritium (strain FD-334 SS-4) TaxID=945553 RepID=A0A0D2LHW3_HYPSF|nr:hypothetical protein HYPSUDRAFT_63453 [Hypholoma sublateritium FD-334 SS-4]